MVPRRVDRLRWRRCWRWLTAAASLSLLWCTVGVPRAYGAAGPQDADPPLTTIDAIRALKPQAANQGRRVLIRGTITYINERDPAGIVVHDGRFGLFVHYGPRYFRAHPRIELHPGDVVEVDGVTTGEGFAPAVVPEAVRRVGHSALPPARRVSYAALLSGVVDCEYIEAVGVGQRAWVSESGKTLFVDIAVEGGQVRAWFWDFSPEDLTRLIDARVRLRGTAGMLYTQARQVRGVALFAGRTADAIVDTSAPPPWSLEVRAISSLFTHHAMDQLDRRVRLRGTVTGTRVGQPMLVEDITMHSRSKEVRHRIYVRDATSAALVETEQSIELAPGDVIDIAGFPVVSATNPTLKNAIIRRVGHVAPPAATMLAREVPLAANHDSELVTVEAVLLTEVATPAGRSLVLKIGDTVFEALHDPRSDATATAPGSGAVVSVTGIYAFEPGPPPIFRLLLRSADDVVLVSAPRWWTSRHWLVLGLFAALTAVAGGVWTRRTVNRNARVREQYRVILAERSRLASELHDTLEQGLAGIQLQLGAVGKTLDSSPEKARRALGIASQMLRYSLSEARRSVMDLRHEALETRDLAGALSDVALQMTTGTSLNATVRTIGPVRPLGRSDEHHLLRIGLEAVTNTIKHARATAVDVVLRFEEDAVHLVVTDDGTGFVEARPDRIAGHFGIRGIEERVGKIGGTLQLGNQSGGGAVVAVRVPMAGRADGPESRVGH
jgi:signal transduction histidine kinase